MPRVTIAAPDGPAEAYATRPPAQGPDRPGVLLFVDAFGLRPRIEQMADRIASWGYVVLAPNTFYRNGTTEELLPREDLRAPGARGRFFAGARRRMSELTTERSLADTTAYLAALRELPDVARGPVGVVGYCMGARAATRAAGAHPDLVGAVGGFHGGRLATDANDSPHHWIPTATAAFCYGHADKDPSMTPAQVALLGETLRSAHLPFSNEVYAGAPHGYTMSDTSEYDEAASERHFAALQTLFREYLAS